MALFYRQLENQILVTGKTFPYKDALKSLGGIFQAGSKSWMIPMSPSSLQEIKTLCQRVGGGILKTTPLEDSTERPEIPPSIATTAIENENLSPPPAGEISFTLSELMGKVQLALTQQFPRAVWVVGEIQNLNQRRQSYYLQLAEGKDGGSQTATITINATIWSNVVAELQRKIGATTWDQVIQDGLQVRVLCQVSLYKDRGAISLNIMDLDPNYTKGALALAREKLLKELRQKGLADANKRLVMSAFPLKIGLITADQSRAMSDFLHQLHSLHYPGSVVFYPAQMQGEGVLNEVVAGIKALQSCAVDVIVITRGGGSAADLRWFDSPEIAYAVAGSTAPIIAAIGHHDDVCIAEEIAWRREKTPTAAADFIAEVIRGTKVRLDQYQLSLARTLQNRWETLLRTWSTYTDRLQQAVQQQMSMRMESLMRLILNLQQMFAGRLLQTQQSLVHWAHALKDKINDNLATRGDLLTRTGFNLTSLARSQTEKQSLRLLEHRQQLVLQVRENLMVQMDRLTQYEKKIIALDPSPWLDKGWTRLSKQGRAITSGDQIDIHDILEARLRDALVSLEVKTKQNVASKGLKS